MRYLHRELGFYGINESNEGNKRRILCFQTFS